MPRKVQDLLLAPQLSGAEVADLLAPYGFFDVVRADAVLQAIAEEPSVRLLLAEVLEPLLTEFGRSADPDQALLYFERFTEAALNKLTLLSYLKEIPHAIPLLARVFGASPFMSQILHRHPYHFYFVSGPKVLEKGRPEVELMRELNQSFQSLMSAQSRLDYLRTFKRKELLRIGVRDLLREATVPETVRDLTALAEVLVKKTLEVCREGLDKRFGRPPTGGLGFVILGMGKFGGGELNFSSDIDLIYLHADVKGKTRGVRGDRESAIPAREYFQRLAQETTSALTRMTEEGSLFRVDLRLRPEGSTGSIADSLSRYIRYYRTRGRNWERMALIKAWPIAGDIRLGKKFLERIGPFVYPRKADLALFREVAGIKGQIERKIGLKGEKTRNVKLGIGGIREIEFLVQALQVVFGSRFPKIRDRNTLRSLEKLNQAGFLTGEEAKQLSEAYIFLRDVEHKLQMVYEAQTHSLPSDAEGLRRLALRMGYEDGPEGTAGVRFQRDLGRHRDGVRKKFEGLFHSKDPEILRRVPTKRGGK